MESFIRNPDNDTTSDKSITEITDPKENSEKSELANGT